MTSEQVTNDLEDLKRRIWQVENALKAPPSLDDGLALQREHDSLTAYQTRLQTQLEAALTAEAKAKKEQEHAELDAQLAELEATYRDLDAEAAQIVREVAPVLQDACERFMALRGEMIALEPKYESTFYKRHRDYPTNKTDLRAKRQRDKSDRVREVTEAAFVLLAHEEAGRGEQPWLWRIYTAILASAYEYRLL